MQTARRKLRTEFKHMYEPDYVLHGNVNLGPRENQDLLWINWAEIRNSPAILAKVSYIEI
jgi:hypothetical protein